MTVIPYPGSTGVVGASPVDPSDRPVGRREDAIAHGIPNQHQIVHAQRVFENEKHVAFCDRAAGRQTDRALRARIDDIAHIQDVAQNHLGDRRDRRILEIQRKSLRAVGGGRARLHDGFDRGSEIAGRPGRAPASVGVGRRLGKARLQIRPANGVVSVWRVLSLLPISVAVCRQPLSHNIASAISARMNEKPGKAKLWSFNTPPQTPANHSALNAKPLCGNSTIWNKIKSCVAKRAIL